MKNKIDILGVPVDKITMDAAVNKVRGFIKEEGVHTIFTPNPEIIMIADENPEFKRILTQADMVVPDGIGVVIASKIQKGERLPERVAGYDLVQNTMQDAVKHNYKYYFFGSKPKVAELAADKMRQKYPGIQIVGCRDGYFKEKDIPSIIDDINNSGANIVLVALGAPKQEVWIDTYKEQLHNVKVAIGVGGSLDGMAEIVKRAPVIFQKMGLEWFYRLICEPTRAKRMLVLPKFVLKVWNQK